MAEYLTIARPYAKALFANALSTQRLQDWNQWLQSLAAIASDPKITQVIDNPKVSFQKVADIFFKSITTIFQDIKDDDRILIKNFIDLLNTNKRLILLPEIAELYEQLLAEQEGTMNVVVTSVQPLEEQHKLKLQKVLEKRFSTTVNLEYDIDESLIGGIIIRTDQWVLDGTVREKLTRLAETLL